MLSLFNMNVIDDYVDSVMNEIAVDAHIYYLMGASVEEHGGLPRPGKWLAHHKNNKIVLPLVTRTARFVWVGGGAGIYFFMEFARSGFCWLWHRNKLSEALSEGEFAIAFSSRAIDLIGPSMHAEPQCWITFPWVSNLTISSSAKTYDILSLLTSFDLIRALYLSILATYHMAIKSETSRWTLQSYTSFKWFICHIGLQKLKARRFIIAEHYDRWAVLADSLGGDSNRSILTIVQHGALRRLSGQDSESEHGLPFELPRRLRKVKQVYAYDEQSANVFRKSILDLNNKDVDFVFYQPMIKLSETKESSRLRILFVGNPLCDSLHIYLFNEISKEYSTDSYYKPHPTAVMDEELNGLNWKIIKERTEFPNVDLLISYPSTLVSEYSNAGIPAIVHPINLHPEEANSFLCEIRHKLNELTEE